MDSWERFYETSFSDKKGFCISLNMEDITDVDYRHAKRVWKDFNITNIGKYHGFYVLSDILLLAEVFAKFTNTCLEICELDPAHLLSVPRLAWRACLKETEIEL